MVVQTMKFASNGAGLPLSHPDGISAPTGGKENSSSMSPSQLVTQTDSTQEGGIKGQAAVKALLRDWKRDQSEVPALRVQRHTHVVESHQLWDIPSVLSARISEDFSLANMT